jgi:hypothetical protein
MRPARDEIGGDVPLRLDHAAEVAFPDGTMTAAMLRRQANRGNLAVERIAGKLYTTLADIREMRRRCREEQKAPGSGFSRNGDPEATSNEPSGASLTTEDISAAQDALRRTVAALRKPSPSTSARGGSPASQSSARRTA